MEKLNEPWLVAAWPGMGLVGHLAADHLVRALGAKPLAEIAAGDHFDPAKIEVREGLLVPMADPRTVLSLARGSDTARDLVILQAQRQPNVGVRDFCEKVIAYAREIGVVRAFTFAAMALPTPPDAASRVFTVATEAALAAELKGFGLELLREGEIGGMNGVLLAAAAQRGIPGACLLGEFPFFASGIPNPKASAAVLRAFAKVAGLEIDLTELDTQAVEVEKQLMTHVKRLEDIARAQAAASAAEKAEGEEPSAGWPAPSSDDSLSAEDESRIESMFRAAQADHSKAIALKAELDRLDVFKRFEDRFLDLFKRAE
jgi:uncharacterized protein